MNGKKVLRLSIIIIFLVLFTTVGCLDTFHDHPVGGPIGLGSFDDIRHYTFEPKTILALLDQGGGEIFLPLPDYVEGNVFPPGSFAWRQQDYLKIANGLNQFSEKDTLDDWNLYRMSFNKDCGDNPIGFDYANFTYFKTNGEQYAAREMDVYPLKKETDWGGNTDFPRPFLFGWKSVDLEKLKVTADDVLQMAEANGGKEARLAEKNSCYISVILSPNTDHENWGVSYYGSHSATLFQMVIDPYTGSYRIIPSK